MPTDAQDTPRSLPEHPNLRHLKAQAKDLLKAGEATSLTDAQFKIARLYGFASWPKLKAHVDSLAEIGQLKLAIEAEDLAQVKSLMTRNPALHRAPLGYGKNGPLTWVAECRVPWGPPSPTRLEIARWMIENGSDVHQGGDGPLMRAALNAVRVPMMELLVAYGADVNAEWNGNFPILFAACEAVNAVSLKWLLEHGANPNCGNAYGCVTALDYLICGYARSSQLPACIDLILAAGGKTKYDAPGVLDLLRGRIERLAEQLDADPELVNKRFPELDCGQTGARNLLLRGATLLHVAAEYSNLEAARLLLERGAQVDARATVDENGIGGQTPIFHAVTQFDDWGLPVAQLLVERGADLSIRAKLPGAYERPDEVVECTPLGYALQFPGVEGKTVKLLRERGGRATPSETVTKTRPGITEEAMNKDERTGEAHFRKMRELELMKLEAEMKLKYIREVSGTTLTQEQEAKLKEELSRNAQELEEGLRARGYKGWPPSETQEQEFDAKLLAKQLGIKAGREDELAKLPQIPMQQAIQIAIAQQSGTVLECRLVGRVVEDLWLAFYDVRILSAEGAERTFTRFAISAIDGRILGRDNKR